MHQIKNIEMKCPNCNETLIMTDRQGIEVNYCPACRGIWLDKGELDKIIERSAEWEQRQQGPPPSQQTYKGGQHYGDHHPDSYYNKHKKKKGLLGDFFDFD